LGGSTTLWRGERGFSRKGLSALTVEFAVAKATIRDGAQFITLKRDASTVPALKRGASTVSLR
jgi:hypothetical protein